MRSRFLCAAALLAIAATGPAMAADLAVKAPVYKAPPPVAPLWTGFYIGANGGYATGDWKGTITDTGRPTSTFPGDYKVDADGGFGGGQIGYNWEGFLSPRGVLGIEADFEGGSIKGSSTLVGIPDRFGKTFDFKLDWFGTVRGRLGYDAGGWLPYVTGGLAYGHTKMNDTVTYNGPVSGIGSADQTRVGWTAGAGVEYAVDPHWSLKAEYLHIDLGSKGTTFNGTLVPSGAAWSQDGYHSKLSFDTVKAGVNYKF